VSVALLYRCAKESGQALNCPTSPSIVFLGVKMGHTWARRKFYPLAGARCLRQFWLLAFDEFSRLGTGHRSRYEEDWY
jgi:hypothetical protein